MSETTRAKKKLYIKTYGCQMNVYDSGRMADVLAPLGYAPTDRPEDADMVILNTCHIREKAAEKVYSELGRLRALQRERPADAGRQLIAVAGCVAQAEGEEILRRAPQVDMVVGPQTYHRLPEMVAQVERAGPRGETGGRGVMDTDFPEEDKFDRLPEESAPQGQPPSCRSRRAATSSAPSASCPTPAAPSSRGPRPRSWRRRDGWPPRARARSRCWARTSTPTTARPRTAGANRAPANGDWAGWCANWRSSRASSGSATPPAIPSTSTTS